MFTFFMSAKSGDQVRDNGKHNFYACIKKLAGSFLKGETGRYDA